MQKKKADDITSRCGSMDKFIDYYLKEKNPQILSMRDKRNLLYVSKLLRADREFKAGNFVEHELLKDCA